MFSFTLMIGGFGAMRFVFELFTPCCFVVDFMIPLCFLYVLLGL